MEEDERHAKDFSSFADLPDSCLPVLMSCDWKKGYLTGVTLYHTINTVVDSILCVMLENKGIVHRKKPKPYNVVPSISYMQLPENTKIHFFNVFCFSASINFLP